MPSWLKYDFWFGTPTDWQTYPYLPFIVIFGLVLLVCLYYRWDGRWRFLGNHPVKTRVGDIGTNVAATIASLGLFLLWMHYASVTFLSMQVWWYLTLLAAVAFIVYGIYYLATVYPGKMEAYKAQEIKNQYLPKPKKNRGPVSARRAR